jgi:hypothetical protein
LDCPGGGYDVEPIVEPVAERQNIRALKAQVSHSAILLNAGAGGRHQSREQR